MVYNLNSIKMVDEPSGLNNEPVMVDYLSGYKEKIVYNHKRYGHDALIKRFN